MVLDSLMAGDLGPLDKLLNFSILSTLTREIIDYLGSLDMRVNLTTTTVNSLSVKMSEFDKVSNTISTLSERMAEMERSYSLLHLIYILLTYKKT